MSGDPIDVRDDLKQRMTSLARALLVLDGAALAISISLFLGSGGPELLPSETQLLRISWWTLLGSLAASTGVLAAMLLRRWRALGIALGIVAFLSFLAGFALLVAVSASALGVYTDDDAAGTTLRRHI